MAKSTYTNHNTCFFQVVILVLVLLLSYSPAAARLLKDDVSEAMYLALQSDNIGNYIPEKAQKVMPCDLATDEIIKPRRPEGILGFQAMRIGVGGRMKPLMVLNVLPKGRIPFSGPSRKTNSINN